MANLDGQAPFVEEARRKHSQIITASHILLGEGKDEVRFFEALGCHIGLRDFQAMDYAGKNNLRPFLSQFPKMRDFAQVASLIVTRDADHDWGNTFASVRDALANAKLPVPSALMEWVGDAPKVSIMLLPENGANGTLEDLCLAAVSEDPAMSCVNEYFSCLQCHSVPSGIWVSKAKVHAFLSSRPEPDCRLGEAAEKRYWYFDHTVYDEVKRLLKELTREA